MKLNSQRLTLKSLCIDVVEALIQGEEEFLKRTQLSLKDSWPPNEIKVLLPFYHESLIKNESLFQHGIFILINNKNELVGNITIRRNPIKEVTELGYFICPSERSKGFATEAVQKICSYTRFQQEIKCIYAECDINNIASERVLKKSNFSLYNVEGDIKQFKLSF